MKICFIDTETTGLDPKKNRIWQIAGTIRVDGKNKKKFNIKNKKSEKALFLEFEKIINQNVDRYNTKDKMFLVAYNSKFDEDFIREMFNRSGNKFYGSYFYNPSICVMKMAAMYFMQRPRRKRPDDFKLGTMCRYFKIPVRKSKLHDASYDADITQKLFNKLYKPIKK